MEVTMTGKKWYESKTIWFNIVMTVLQVVNLLISLTDDPRMTASLVAVQTIGNIVLRVWFTSVPVGTIKGTV